MEDDCFSLDMLVGVESMDLFFPKNFSSFFAGLYPWGHLESILQVLDKD